MEKKNFRGRYVVGELYRGVKSGLYHASVYFGIGADSKTFKSENEAMKWLDDYGCFQK